MTLKDKLRPTRLTPFPDGPEFVLVPAGKFIMGQKISGEIDDHPPHEVEITKPFYLAAHPLGTTDAFIFTGLDEDDLDDIGGKVKRASVVAPDSPLHPYARYKPNQSGIVENVPILLEPGESSFAILDEINKLSHVRLAGYRFRFPTEAEWEYAAKAGDHELKWMATDVGEYMLGRKPNPFGIYGMTHFGRGEQVSDFYSSSYYLTSPFKDPTGPVTSEGTKVIRGFMPDAFSENADDKALPPIAFVERLHGVNGRLRLVLEFLDDQ